MNIEKIEVAQSHIDNMDKRIVNLIKDIKTEQHDIAKFLEIGDIKWVGISAAKMKEYCDQHKYFLDIKKEMQSLLDFLIKDGE